MLHTRPLCLILIIFSLINLSLSETAYCLLHNPTFTEILGTIQFIQPDPQSPTTIILEFSNLPPGIHGFHLNKACNLPPGHFDPAGPHHHGAPTAQDRHAGDLGNIVVDSNGEVAVTFNDSVITLFGANSIIGGGCVIHQGEDDLGLGGFSDSLINGHAGPGLACGEIIEGDVVQAVRDDAEMQAMAKANHVAAVISIVSLVVQQAFNSGTLSVATTLMAANVLQYVRFIEIEYPTTLETLYKIQGLKPINLNFGPLFPQGLKVTAKEYVPLPRFARYQISSLMLVNYWTTIVTTPILFLIAIFGIALGLLIKRNPFLRKGYNWFRDFLLWNFLIGFFLSNLDALILWSIVEYRSLRLDSGFARGSFALNILLVLTGVSLLVLFTVKICLINKKEKNLPLEQQVERHKSIKVIFAEVKNRHLVQQLFLPIFAFRIILNNIILAAVDNSQVQCVFLLCATVVTMIYLVVIRPCRSLWKNFELFSYELLTLVVNTACVKLSFVSLDFNDAMVKQGKTIQNSTIAVNWLTMFFTVIDAAILAYQFAVKKKLCRRKKQKAEKAKDPGQQAQPTEAKGINIEAIDELGPIPNELGNNDDVSPEKLDLPYIYEENNDDVPPEKVNVSDVQIELELGAIKSKQSSLTGLL